MPRIARELEPQFAAAGCAVVSNSSALRMQADVPLVIPEVNGDHIRLIEKQSWRTKSGGYVVTNPNCSAIGLVLALAPLHRAFTLETVMAVTMQAVSGAGYPGVASLDILGNVIPYIAKEEEKMEEETQKLLGTLNGARVDPAPFAMSAQCNRVAVEDGHTESVAVRLKKKAAPEEIIAAWNDFRAEPQQLRLPSAPEQPVVYMTAAGSSATALRLRPRRRHDHRGRTLAQVQRSRLEVHRPVAQHHSWRRRRCAAECRTAQGEGVSRVRTVFTTETRRHGEKQNHVSASAVSDDPEQAETCSLSIASNNPERRSCGLKIFSVPPCLRGELL